MAGHLFSFYIIKTFRLFGLILLRGIAFLWPRSGKEIVIGGWCGELFIDNPKYLLLYLLENTDYKITWIGKSAIVSQLPSHINLRFARMGSLYAFWRLLNARTWICCQAINLDLTSLPILGRGTCIDLWHGILIKLIGESTPKLKSLNLRTSYFAELYHKMTQQLDSWVAVSNERMVDILCQGEPSRYKSSRILRVGTPRNDFLINNSYNEKVISALRHKYASILGFDENRKIVLYLPTWRMRGDCVFAFYNQKSNVQEDWKKMLESHDAILIEKHHYGTYARYPLLKDSICSIAIPASLQNCVDVQELLLIANVLISDYSGAYIDYALLRRPVIHFAYDLEEYSTADSGLAYNLYDVAAGPIVTRLSELKTMVCQALTTTEFHPAKGFDRLVEYETGNASAKITDFIRSI